MRKLSQIASGIYQAAKKAATGAWDWKAEWKNAMKAAWEQVINKVKEAVVMLTAKQVAVRKIVQDTINSIKPHLLCQTAPAEVYEKLAMIYIYHRSCKMSHNDAVNRSFARLNGNGVSNADMIRLAQDTINRQSDIVAKIAAMM
jgi:hypothetical protein